MLTLLSKINLTRITNTDLTNSCQPLKTKSKALTHAAVSFLTLTMAWKLTPIDVPPPNRRARQPRRNTRDPRLPSYKRPPQMARPCGVPINIPLDYSPLLDAVAPIRKPNFERQTRLTKAQVSLTIITSKFLVKQCSLLSPLTPQLPVAPDMVKLLHEMEAIHAPPIHPKKIAVGKIIKGVRPPKGSINVPRKPRPRDPRRRPPTPPRSPDDSKLKAASKLNKSRIFSLSDTEVRIHTDNHVSKLLQTAKANINTLSHNLPDHEAKLTNIILILISYPYKGLNLSLIHI